ETEKIHTSIFRNLTNRFGNIWYFPFCHYHYIECFNLIYNFYGRADSGAFFITHIATLVLKKKENEGCYPIALFSAMMAGLKCSRAIKNWMFTFRKAKPAHLILIPFSDN